MDKKRLIGYYKYKGNDNVYMLYRFIGCPREYYMEFVGNMLNGTGATLYDQWWESMGAERTRYCLEYVRRISKEEVLAFMVVCL